MRERLLQRDREFEELENCFANYRREVQIDLDELTQKTNCTECNCYQDELNETKKQLGELEKQHELEKEVHIAKAEFTQNLRCFGVDTLNTQTAFTFFLTIFQVFVRNNSK